jgi:hypothetical protein
MTDPTAALVASINGHREGRDPTQVDREIWAALHGASIEGIQRLREGERHGTEATVGEVHLGVRGPSEDRRSV